MKTILLVEDENDLRYVIKTTLECPEYRILEAQDGKRALEILGSEEVHLVLLDWMMPEVNGMMVAEAVRGNPAISQVPIIMVTARSQETDFEQGRAIGAFAYLVKPFSPLELLAKVEEALA